MASRSFVQWRAPPGRHEPRPLHGVWVDGGRDGSWGGEWWRERVPHGRHSASNPDVGSAVVSNCFPSSHVAPHHHVSPMDGCVPDLPSIGNLQRCTRSGPRLTLTTIAGDCEGTSYPRPPRKPGILVSDQVCLDTRIARTPQDHSLVGQMYESDSLSAASRHLRKRIVLEG